MGIYSCNFIFSEAPDVEEGIVIKTFFFYSLIAVTLALITYVSWRSAAQVAREESVKATNRLPDHTQ